MKSWRVDLKGKSNFCLLKICKIVTAFTLTSRFFSNVSVRACSCLYVKPGLRINIIHITTQSLRLNDFLYCVLHQEIFIWNFLTIMLLILYIWKVFRIDQISNNLILGKILQERYQIYCIILNELLTQHMVDLGKIFSQSCAINNNI